MCVANQHFNKLFPYAVDFLKLKCIIEETGLLRGLEME